MSRSVRQADRLGSVHRCLCSGIELLPLSCSAWRSAPQMDKDPRLTAEAVAAIQARFGLDKPLHSQFQLYVVNLLRGDMGISFHTQRPVADMLPRAYRRLYTAADWCRDSAFDCGRHCAGGAVSMAFGNGAGFLRTGDEFDGLGEARPFLAGHYPAFLGCKPLCAAHRRQAHTRFGLRFNVGAVGGCWQAS